MLKLIHGADFHLDSPFSGLTPEQAAHRRGEQRQLLGDLARVAREKEADLVLLSGDLMDSARLYRETAQALAQALGSIPCPVFISPGNHDSYSFRSVYATLDWPDNVHIFTSNTVEAVELPARNCTVYGRAFCAAQEEVRPLANFRANRDSGRIQLMCLHADLAPQSRYAPISPSEIAASGLDYLALGHIHQCTGLQQLGGTYWAYPGCPEGRGFDETGEKGVLYAEVERGFARAQFIPLARHRYEILPVDITGRQPLEAILAALPEQTGADIYRILLTGEGDAPHVPALQRALAPRFLGLTLLDHTRPPQDLWARRGEDSLTGLFLQAMWSKCQAEPDNQLLPLALRFGLAALEQGEDVAP